MCDRCELGDEAPPEVHDVMHFLLRVRPRRVRLHPELFRRLAPFVAPFRRTGGVALVICLAAGPNVKHERRFLEVRPRERR